MILGLINLPLAGGNPSQEVMNFRKGAIDDGISAERGFRAFELSAQKLQLSQQNIAKGVVGRDFRNVIDLGAGPIRQIRHHVYGQTSRNIDVLIKFRLQIEKQLSRIQWTISHLVEVGQYKRRFGV